MVTRIKPYNPRAKDLVADWHVIDASGEVLGRLASRVAWLLMGKHKPGYVRHLSSGDFVVVVNAQKVRTTGKKSEQIVYRRHSQYPGNLKEIPYQRVMETHPTRIIEHAVRGMLPKSKLGDRMYTRLKVYAEETHPHVAQLTGSQRRIERLAAEATETAEDAVKAAVQEATSPARRRRRPARPAVDVPEPVVADASPTEAATDDAPAVEAPPRPPRRRRRRRTRSAAAAAAVAAGETAAGPATTDAPAAEVEASADNAVGDESSMQRPAGSVQAEGNDDTAADDRNKDVPGDA
jgi:large subunit ribosomal protein L13